MTEANVDTEITENDDEVRRIRASNRAPEIVDAAAKLWAEHGYHGTGIEELSQTLGIQSATLYYHIYTKETLLHEIGYEAISGLLELSRPILLTGSAEEQFRQLSGVLLDHIVRNQNKWTVFFREIGWLTGAHKRRIFRLRAEYESLWAEVFARGVEQEMFAQPDPLLVKGILGMHNYTYLWYRQDGPMTAENLSALFVETLLNGIRLQR